MSVRSIRVTSAPCFLAERAAAHPAQPAPMTATFILAFTQGVAEATEGANVLVDGFGVIAMVAMAPLIALQILGFVFKVKSKKEGLESNE